MDRAYSIKEHQAKKKGALSSVITVGAMDYTLLIVVVILALIGVVMVFSSSFMRANTELGDPYFYLKKQGVFFAAGLLLMLLMSNINYEYIRRLALLLYVIANLLLVLVLVIGISSHGATRWIPLPLIGQFQPSEVAKAALIFFLSFLISNNKKLLTKWPTFILLCGIAAITSGLVFLGNNMSTAIIVMIIGIGVIFTASPYIARFVVAVCGGVAAILGYLALSSASENFRAARFEAFLHPFDYPKTFGFQIIQSLYAIASGGMFGLGLGQSRQKTFLPEAHNDIIFSIICEELGFIGAAAVLLLFGILIWRGIKTAMNAPDTFSCLTAMGIMILVSSQVLINVAVVTNSIPNTGVPLPFISYGGTSLLVAMGLIGVLLNISRCVKT
ncbi:MAG: putative lipid II flippase FtsW [Clostridiales bacterium]|jgi:cell division protein FtsW|nr:putative lipid II flippase FtsW [Clostridiales bacterium]